MNSSQIGRLIHNQREVLGIDQRTLAELASVASHTISNLETGKANPTVEILERICKVLGLELVVRQRSPADSGEADS